MRRVQRIAALCTALALLGWTHARADEAAAIAALRRGGHVALMRHTDAPGGAGDPPGFRLEDCTTQRNLSDRGRSDAKAMGEKLRMERVSFGKVLSSPWCRCLETARLMEMGQVEAAVTFGNAYTQRNKRDDLTKGARQVIANWKGPGSILIITHGANIQPLTGINPQQGEIVVVAAGSTELREVGRIAPPRR